MDSLIQKLREAEDGCKDLDFQIMLALEGKPAREYKINPSYSHLIPAYTTSLDAAKALVPEGWRVTHAYWNEAAAGVTVSRGMGEYWSALKRTPALALCIAALKARNQIQQAAA